MNTQEKIESFQIKSTAHRARAIKLWEGGELVGMVQAMWEICEATRCETYIDMLKDPKHTMWRCIELDKAREGEKIGRPGPQLRTRPQWRWDTTKGYKGKECNTQIHSGTQRIARLTFK